MAGPRERCVCGKAIYASQKEAELALADLRRWRNDTARSSYPCDRRPGFWHLTSWTPEWYNIKKVVTQTYWERLAEEKRQLQKEEALRAKRERQIFVASLRHTVEDYRSSRYVRDWQNYLNKRMTWEKSPYAGRAKYRQRGWVSLKLADPWRKKMYAAQVHSVCLQGKNTIRKEY